MQQKAGRVASAILCLALFVGLADSRPSGQTTDNDNSTASFETYRAQSYTELVERLEKLAAWCRGKRIFVEYGKTLSLILEFEPRNALAMKGLGFKKRGRDWNPPKTPKSFKNFGEKALPDVPAHYREAIAPLIASHVRWIKGGELSLEQRSAALADILRLDPENPFFLGASVEIRAAAASVLPETLLAKERRAELTEWVNEAFTSAPKPRTGELLDRDHALGVQWLGVVETSAMRVVYATDHEEADRLLYALHATESLFKSLFPKRRGLPRGLTVYLMEDEAQKASFLANHPRVTDKNRSFLQKLGGSGIQGSSDFAFWSGDAQRRADGIVRIAIGWLFQGGFGFSVEIGWAYEGFGLYLTRLLVRTRLNWTAQAEPLLVPAQDFKLRTRLLLEDTNWMEEAQIMWKAGRAPDFAQLMRKNVNELSTEDILASYVLAAYLLEGQPKRIDAFLRLTGSRTPLEKQVETVFAWDLETLRERAGRWLRERH